MYVEIWCLLLGGFAVAVAAFSAGFVLMACCCMAGRCDGVERRGQNEPI